MIDIHSHVLFGVDDGSQELSQSLLVLQSAADAGMQIIIATPHYMRGFYDNTRTVIDNKFSALSSAMHDQNISIKLLKGAEVYLTDDLVIDDILNENLFIENTKYVLVETEMNGFPADLHHILYKMVKKGMRPILAHPERYRNIQQNPSSAEDFIFRDVYLQINAASLLGGYGRSAHDTAWFLVENGLAHFIGSDSHCQSAEYGYPLAIQAIAERLGDGLAELLSTINPSKMLANEKVSLKYMYTPPTQSRKRSFWDILLGR